VTIWPRKHKRKTPSQAFTRSKQIYRIGRSLKFCGTVHCPLDHILCFIPCVLSSVPRLECCWREQWRWCYNRRRWCWWGRGRQACHTAVRPPEHSLQHEWYVDNQCLIHNMNSTYITNAWTTLMPRPHKGVVGECAKLLLTGLSAFRNLKLYT